MEAVEDIRAWLLHRSKLTRKGQKTITPKKGYRVLFNGPARAGKIETAQMLGKGAGREVHRVKVTQVVSKYIGETEKNLAALFKEAKGKDWILFFDEADALFSKRTTVNDSHDRYANGEVSLLQRIESYPGLVIFAINLKENIDKAFARRFQAVIQFP